MGDVPLSSAMIPVGRGLLWSSLTCLFFQLQNCDGQSAFNHCVERTAGSDDACLDSCACGCCLLSLTQTFGDHRTMNSRTLADRSFTATWVSFVAFLVVGLGLRSFVDAEAVPRLERMLDWMTGLLLLLTVGSAAVAFFSFLIRGR